MRLYTEAEVQDLLRRAAALQATAPSRTGLTLDEIQKAAEAAGIDPSFVAAAAARPVHTDALSQRPGKGFWGGPYTLRHERTVRGTLDDDAWAEIVGELRRAYNVTGDVSESGSMRDWSNGMSAAMGSSYFYQRLSATPRRGQTTLLLEEKMQNASVAYLVPMFAMMGAGLTGILWGAGKVTALPFLLCVLAFVATFVGARALYAGATTRAAQRATDVLDRIDERLDEIASESTSAAAPEATSAEAVHAAPALTLPDAEVAPDDASYDYATRRDARRV